METKVFGIVDYFRTIWQNFVIVKFSKLQLCLPFNLEYQSGNTSENKI